MEADFNSTRLTYMKTQVRWNDILKKNLIDPRLYYSEPFASSGSTLRDTTDKSINTSMSIKSYAICLNKEDSTQAGRYLVFLMNALKQKGINVIPLYDNDTNINLSNIQYIIIGSRIPSTDEQLFMKNQNIQLIYVFATNPMVDDVERFAYNTTIPVERMDFVRSCNQIWLTNPNKQHQSYLKALYRLPISIIPNLWTNIYSSNETIYTPKSPSEQLEIVLLDSNTTFNTSCWKQLVTCEQLYLQNQQLINKVYLFNTPDTNKSSMDMIGSLTFKQQGKMRIFKSLPIKDIVSFFLQSKLNVVFLTNQIFDDLSYDYYDVLYAGFPLVHSSKTLKDANIGRYYDSLDIQSAIQQLQVKDYDVQTNTANNRAYLSKLIITDTTFLN